MATRKTSKKAAKKAAKKTTGKATKKKASNRVGRPPLPKKDLRSKVFCVRLKTDEWKRIESTARSKGMSPADWAIQKILKGL